MNQGQTRVAEAEKKVNTVLEKLESETGGEVKHIALDNMVDTDPETGRPVVKKAVNISVAHKTEKKWAT